MTSASGMQRFAALAPFAVAKAAANAIAMQVQAAIASRHNRRIVNGLTELDDSLLRDIGLTRKELDSVLLTSKTFEDPSSKLAVKARNGKNGLAELSLG
ncbi:DUF1127 domain-containing protein [Allorhizobium undicola]|uniref:DUF1127 domain-containing protein n=1 Tax=Allorhizobium undicola TaxID=78527 RepID=UPI000A7C9DDB|nr:DUF1127 domain-containing protein [Allorhizobium undicola]